MMATNEGAQLPRQPLWLKRLGEFRQRLTSVPPLIAEGTLKRMVGLTLEAVGCEMPVGSCCRIVSSGGELEAEVVGFAGDRLFLMPTGTTQGVAPNARVIPLRGGGKVPAGYGLLGRVLDGAGKPLDSRGPLQYASQVPLTGKNINPLARQPICEPLDVGVQAINSLLTVGRGQRMGLFAGSGVGKSSLLGMMTRFTEADITVVGLIGERGREVKEFVQNTLGEEGMQRAVVVATPADYPPLMRVRGAWVATAIAEYFRDCGHNVLLLMDSLTRVAMAQREIGLAIGEPPATKGYPPSVFTLLPRLVERAGNGDVGGGSITAIYTVLAEGDDPNDPVVDSARAILDGHIVLSRRLAEAGHFPAIDVEASISRAMTEIVDNKQLILVRRFRQIYAAYQQNRDLIAVGAYHRGSDPAIDQAIEMWPKIQAFLQQDMSKSQSFEQSMEALTQLIPNHE